MAARTPDLKVGPYGSRCTPSDQDNHETHSSSQHVLGWYYMGRHA
jgi:hypothetical protein